MRGYIRIRARARICPQVESVERVLLDGGPTRTYSPSESDLLLRDLQLIKEYFIARDERGVRLDSLP